MTSDNRKPNAMPNAIAGSPSDPVALRDVEERDLPILFEHQRDPKANEMAAFPAKDKETFMAKWAVNLANQDVVAKTILFGGEVAGYIVCFPQKDKQLIGYWLGQNMWGKGIATRALFAFLRDVKIRPLHAYVAKNNQGSIRVLEKCGFIVTGEGMTPANSDADSVPEFLFTLSK